MALFNVVYHVDQWMDVDQCIYWCESTPPKLRDVETLNLGSNSLINKQKYLSTIS